MTSYYFIFIQIPNTLQFRVVVLAGLLFSFNTFSIRTSNKSSRQRTYDFQVQLDMLTFEQDLCELKFLVSNWFLKFCINYFSTSTPSISNANLRDVLNEKSGQQHASLVSKCDSCFIIFYFYFLDKTAKSVIYKAFVLLWPQINLLVSISCILRIP